jgi:lipid-A-disaccharide synthase
LPDCVKLHAMQFLLSAGEASGEIHGAQLIRALRALAPQAEFFGVGGVAMRAAGCKVVVDSRNVAVLGLAEVVTHLPRIYGEFRKLLHVVDERRPDAAILIDFPDFNLRLAKQLHARKVPVFYYISPQLWAWRGGRIKLVRQYVRKMLVIFPFEEQFYRRQGVDAAYVGHPLAEMDRPSQAREEFAVKAGLDAAKPWIALLPGSRRKEVSLNLPTMLECADLLGPSYDYVLPVASTLDVHWMEGLIRGCRGQTPTPRLAAEANRSGPKIILTQDARASLAHASAGIVASGTATLETALLGTPFVMVYRVSPLTWMLGRRLVKLPHYGIVNLILGRRAVPELVQHEFTAEGVLTALQPLLADTSERSAQREAFAELRQKLRPAGEQPAARRAAETVLASLKNGHLKVSRRE